MAAIFALSLVPVSPAWADTTTGVLGDSTTGKGTITIDNARANETYSLYRLFELASFTDNDTATAVHVDESNNKDEAYSYVIDSTSSWFTFLTTYGPGGANDPKKFAAYNGETKELANAYFEIEREAITLVGADGSTQVSTYHVIKATDNFKNAWDYVGTPTSRDAGPDYVLDDDFVANDGTGSKPNYDRVQDFAQAALKYGAANNLGLETSNASTTTGGELTLLTDAPLGYYLVGTSMGTLASLDTNNLSVTIHEKNDEPTIEKKVLKKGADSTLSSKDFLTSLTDDGAGWVENTDADVNDYVMFRTVVTAQQGAKNYELHDVMEKGLTYVKSGTTATSGTSQDRYAGTQGTNYTTNVYLVRDSDVYPIEASVGTAPNDKTNYTLIEADAASGRTDGCDFEIAFNDADGDGYDSTYAVTFYTKKSSDTNYSFVDVKDGDKIVVTYWAQLNENAFVYAKDGEAEGQDSSEVKCTDGTTSLDTQKNQDANSDDRNTNSTVLTYGNKSYTQWDDATVTTYQLDVAKTKSSEDGEAFEPLAGAVFQMFKACAVDANASPAETAEATLGSTGYVKEEPNAMVFSKGANNTYLYKGNSSTAAQSPLVNGLQSSEDNPINVKGLEAGFYLVYEATAPAGYNKLAHPIVIEVKGDANYNGQNDSGENESQLVYNNLPNTGVAVSDLTVGWDAVYKDAMYTTTEQVPNGGVHVINQTGAELPSTGGIGTTIFYVVGGALVVGSAVMLVTKRRMASDKQ